MTRIIATSDLANIIEEYRAGASSVTLGLRYNVDASTIRWRLKQAGIVRRTPAESHPLSPISDRFWPRVKRTDNCWLWTGGRDGRGYGRCWVDPERGAMGAHCVSWELANQQRIPDGYYVCHQCDNPPCVRPSHLFLGTPKDNTGDAATKGRMRPGLKKLTIAIANEIRSKSAAGAQLRPLAREYGVSKSCIWFIVHHHSYRT